MLPVKRVIPEQVNQDSAKAFLMDLSMANARQ